MSLEHAPQRAGVRSGKKHAAPIGRYLTRKELAAALNVSEQTIYRMTCDGRLEAPIVINSRNLRWPPGTIERFHERRDAPEYAGVERDARK